MLGHAEGTAAPTILCILKYELLIRHAGLVYTYLAGHVGHTRHQGSFRALARGYTHWALGHSQELAVNTNHPYYCHVRCTMNPSVKTGTYEVYLLLSREDHLQLYVLANVTVLLRKCELCL